MCTSFKVGLLDGQFNFGEGTSQTFYIALYYDLATLSAATTAYTTEGEVVGTGYTAGGKQLTISQAPTSTGTTAFLNFSNVSWPSATLTARAALIYLRNGTTNPAIAVLDFGSNKVANNSTFTITFPVSDASNALIRIA